MKVVLEMVGSVRCSQCTDLGPARGWRLKDCLSTRMCLQSIVTADIEAGRASRRGRVSQVGDGMVMPARVVLLFDGGPYSGAICQDCKSGSSLKE